jgi:hypothetical protein
VDEGNGRKSLEKRGVSEVKEKETALTSGRESSD